jgi:predicted nucleic-acid-binding protein
LGRNPLKVTVDTNVLVRAAVADDARQARAAAALLKRAKLVAVTLPTLCEFVWVLRKVYGFGSVEIVAAIRALLEARNVAAHRRSAEAGLAMLEQGGDFADGVTAHEGAWLGGEAFVSFDRQAVERVDRAGRPSRLLPS